VPYERDSRTHYADSSEIAALRAEGHYTVLYSGRNKYFCPWSISEADSRLSAHQFIRVHRSYLVNPAFVRDFQRTKDTGVCLFRDTECLSKVPVSRSRLADVRRALRL
jgi:DNA-binding LytR/AlgR family response regulator